MTLVSFAPYPTPPMPHTLPFTPTRAEGLRRLNAFVTHAGRDYPLNRNYERGPGRHTSVSMLSPYLRHRSDVADVLERMAGNAARRLGAL
jgi:deoxyribodipyrimidine photolyase